MMRSELRWARRAGGAIPAAASWLLLPLLLAACGGGGGSAPVTVGGSIVGQKPGTDLELQLLGSTQSFRSTAYASTAFVFSNSFAAGGVYSLSISKHPAGQLCRISQGQTGGLAANVGNVQIDCSHSLLNDSGISLAPDGNSGRDAEASRLVKTGAGALGFDFTRLCASGDVAGPAPGFSCAATPAFPANAWACNRDNATGLVWLLADTAGDATAPAAACGVAAWRQPSVHELLSIVHAGRPGQVALDPDHFPAAPAAAYLASETYADGGSARWAVDVANQGLAGKFVLASNRARLRWVAGAAVLDNAAVRYSRSAAGANHVLIDNQRELMWLLPNASTALDWAQALDSVATVNAARPGGHGDWRLPNRNELDALVLRSSSAPALDAAVYGDASARAAWSQLFWTGSPLQPATGAANASWVVDFSLGDISPLPHTSLARVLYVRDRSADAAP